MLSHLLLFRLAILNTAAGSVAFWAHQKGLVVPIFAGDVSYLSFAIVALFTLTLISTFVRGAKIGAAKNALKDGYRMRAKAAKMADKNAHIADAAGWLQVLGLLGTVIGFLVAIEGIEADNTASIISGLRTAIGTTILGGFLSLLTSVNYRVLDTATASFVEDVRS
jgi:hypothetical protein